jgi:hypothetical protein
VDPVILVRFISASAMIVGGFFVAFMLVYGRLSAILRRRPRVTPPRPLTPHEVDSLRLWQRRTVSWFVLTMGAVVTYGFSFGLAWWLPSWVYLAESMVVLILAVAGLAVHVSGRCPVCGRRIGFQSGLLLPLACEICGAVFRPAAWLAPLTPALSRNIHVVSQIRILGWPLFAVAFGPDPATGRTVGVARAVVAVGDVAVGVIAVGGVGVGVIPVAGVSLGVLSVGGVAIGIAAVGGLAAGALALGGLAFGVQAMGGIAIGSHALGALTASSVGTPVH